MTSRTKGSWAERIAMLLLSAIFLLFGLVLIAFMGYIELQSRGSWLAVAAYYSGLGTGLFLFASLSLLFRLRMSAAHSEYFASRPVLISGVIGGAAGSAVSALVEGATISKSAVMGAAFAFWGLLILGVVIRLLGPPGSRA